MIPRTILAVDDERDIVDLLAYNLEREGFAVIRSYDGSKALETARLKVPDLILLDLMLPGISGLDICRILRSTPETAAIPIIMLTAKAEEVDKIIGLEMGADDYITKPFSVKELIARIRAVLRRREGGKDRRKNDEFTHGDLRINYVSYEVFLAGEKIALSPTELKLLFFFSRHPGRVYTRNQILDHVWGDDTFVTPRAVDVHIRRLRSQIEKDMDNPQYIFTVRGVGYKFSENKNQGIQ